MIPKMNFGRTGHASTRVIFGGYALSQATQAEAERVLELLPKNLQTAERFTARPADTEMRQLLADYDIQPIFT